jgi:hypothetical protein
MARMSEAEHKFTRWWLGLVVLLIAIVIVAPNVLHRFVAAHSAQAGEMGGLQTICTANLSYGAAHRGSRDELRYAPTLKDLAAAGYMDELLASGEEAGFRFEYFAERSAAGAIEHYHVLARPVDRSPGARTFYMDDNCKIHVTEEARDATASDPILK